MKHSLPLGVSFALLSTLSYSLLAAIVKGSARECPLPQVVFMQCSIGLALLSIVISLRGKRYFLNTLKTAHPLLHGVRALFSLGISYFMFYAVRQIPLVDAMLLANTSPFIVPFLSLLLFRQKINHKLWLPIATGFVGVLLTLKPEGDFFNLAMLLPFGSAFCIAIALMLIRKMTAKDSTATIGFYFFLYATLISGVFSLSSWQPLSREQWAILSLVGFLFFLCQYSLSIALRYVKAEIVSSLYYSNIFYGALISLFWFDSAITPSDIAGMTLIVTSGILCIWCEGREMRPIKEV